MGCDDGVEGELEGCEVGFVGRDVGCDDGKTVGFNVGICVGEVGVNEGIFVLTVGL